MASAVTDSTDAASVQTDPVSGAAEFVRSPLAILALSLTTGIVLDRYLSIPAGLSLVVAVLSLIAWFCSRSGGRGGLPQVYLGLTTAALGAAYLHLRLDVQPADHIGKLLRPEPQVIQVRGFLAQEPVVYVRPAEDVLRSMPAMPSTSSTLALDRIRIDDDWLPVSGTVRLVVQDELKGLHCGDEVEVVGRIASILPPANPGERDVAADWRDRQIAATLTVAKTGDAVTRLSRGWPRSLDGWLAVLRGWCQGVLRKQLDPNENKLAAALLLGEGSGMTSEDWDKYIRTGVIHVLAISGQHLAILAFFLWWILRLIGVRRKNGAIGIAIILVTYALLTGFHPPVVRSAVAVVAFCGALRLRRSQVPLSSFALGWLIVAILNPADIFNVGCQLSFISVAVLFWGTQRGEQVELSPLDKLIESVRPRWQKVLYWVFREIGKAYFITILVWLALTPLIISRYHMVSLIGPVLGPPVVFLSSIGLIAGFLMLLLAAIWSPLGMPFAWLTQWSLRASDALVTWTDALPGSHVYVSGIPEWWLWGFYLALLGWLILEARPHRWQRAVPTGLTWICVGLVAGAAKLPEDEFRCTFLAVGHGGCTVMETPDGRTLLYDAGAINGPEVTIRHIAPYLWSRGISRIDELFLSHADLDHFNGLPALLDRFTVKQITTTPSFAEKPADGVRLVLETLETKKIPLRTVRAGDRLTAGAVTLEVLHPPGEGPAGVENVRSLVLMVQHESHRILLTGDLEDVGMSRVLAQPTQPIDVLMAPHHGSTKANTPALAQWARPQLVVSCEGHPRGLSRAAEPYTPSGIRFLGTWPHGAITLHSHATGMVVETFVSQERFVLRNTAGNSSR